MSEPQSRQESEREFHDKLFGEGTQSRDEKVGKFYSVIEGSMDFYRDHINRNCKDNRVLDYGCGEGLWSFYMAERGAKVTAIDISEVAIEQARNCIDWRAMDAEDLDLPDDSFDMICGTSILHHLDLEKCYHEIARVLSPDGNAVFLEPMGHNPLINLYRKMTGNIRTKDEHPLRMQDLELAERYFSSVETKFFHLLSLASFPLRNFWFFKPLLKLLHAIEARLFKLVPFLQKYSWMVVIKLAEPKK